MGCAASTSNDVEEQRGKDPQETRDTQQDSDDTTEAATHHTTTTGDDTITVVTARQAKTATALLGAHLELFRPMKLIKVGQSMKTAVGKNWATPDPRNPTDIARCAQALAQVRDGCGILRSDGTFLQHALDELPPPVRAMVTARSMRPPLLADERDAKLGFDLPTTIAHACGMHPSTVRLWMRRINQAADCLLAAATASCELRADGAPCDDPSDTFEAAVRKSARGLFGAKTSSTWDNVVRILGDEPDDVYQTDSESMTDTVLSGLSMDGIRYSFALRRGIRTATSLALFFHGGRSRVAPLARPADAYHLSETYLGGFSAIVDAFWRYCAHPSQGMELVRKVDTESMALLCFLTALGAVPARREFYESFADASAYFLTPQLSPSATRVCVNLLTISTGQLRFDVKDIQRHRILDQLSAAIARSPIARAFQADEPVSSKVFPTFDGEAGEGHGPRKEFFDQCARALSSPTTPPVTLRGDAVVDAAEGSSMCIVRPTSEAAAKKLKDLVVAGNVLQIPHPGEEGEMIEARIHSVRASDDEFGVRVGVMIPVDLDGAAVSAISVHHFQCFALPSPDAKYMWFNGAVSDSVAGRARSLYWTAGWLLGASVANGVSLALPLPPVLFKLLRQHRAETDLVVSEADLIALDSGYEATLASLRAQDAAGFNEYAASLIDDGDESVNWERATPATLDHVREAFISRHVVHEILVHRCKERIGLVAEGFAASQVGSLAAVWGLPATQLQAMICGAPDSPTNDFSFDDAFILRMAGDYTSTPHGSVFSRLILDVLEGRGMADEYARVRFKRQVLKFITGRDLLPAHKKSEAIFIEYPEYPDTVLEYAALAGRLPASHTCTNTLHMPNYLEALVFGASDQACRALTGHTIDDGANIRITAQMKANAWGALEPAQQRQLSEQARRMIFSKLQVAAFGADTYELDDPDSDDDDPSFTTRHQSAMLRGIPAPRRTSTARPNQLHSAVEYLRGGVIPGNTVRAAPVPTSHGASQFLVSQESTAADRIPDPGASEDDFEMPAEDAPQGDTAPAANPFVVPGMADVISSGGHTHSNGQRDGVPDFSKPDMVVNGADFEDDDDDDDEPSSGAAPPMAPSTPPPAPAEALPGQIHDFDD